ncbi:MAG TPA: hypothetical protein VFR37_19160 [Longimicrobium sp.]|nr:hypothetical protein [Longimicrobium sp.]
MKHLQRAALAACLLSAVPAGAHAQPGADPIQVGQTVTGALQEGDLTVFDRGRFRAYRFQATRGQRLVATLESDAFDPYLIVSRVVGPLVEEIDSDDDGGDGTNSRLRVTIPESGTYLVVAQSFSEDGMGAYTLGLQVAPEPTTGQGRTIAPGQTVTGELAETDNPDEEEDRYYDLYTFTGRPGQRITIEMESEDFDTYLNLGRMEDGEFVSVASDDDSGEEGTNSRIAHVVDEEGEYQVRATSFSEASGAYTLTLRERVSRAAGPPRPISSGQEMSGQLDEQDGTLDTDGSYYELWSYQGHAGEQLRIRMDSDDFDTYVAIGRMEECGEFDEIANMDDGGEGTNSLLEVTLPADGEYVIRANSFSADETGSYTLVVESSRDR